MRQKVAADGRMRIIFSLLVGAAGHISRLLCMAGYCTLFCRSLRIAFLLVSLRVRSEFFVGFQCRRPAEASQAGAAEVAHQLPGRQVRFVVVARLRTRVALVGDDVLSQAAELLYQRAVHHLHQEDEQQIVCFLRCHLGAGFLWRCAVGTTLRRVQRGAELGPSGCATRSSCVPSSGGLGVSGGQFALLEHVRAQFQQLAQHSLKLTATTHAGGQNFSVVAVVLLLLRGIGVEVLPITRKVAPIFLVRRNLSAV